MKRSNLARSILLVGIVICILAVVAVLIVSRPGANRTTTSPAPRFAIYLADPVPSSYVGPKREYQFDVGKARVRITEDDIDEYIWASQTIVLKSDVALSWPKVTQVGPEPEWVRFAIGIDGRLVCYGVVMGITSVIVRAPVMYIYPSGAENVFPPTNRVWTGIHVTWARDSGTMMTSAADERLFPCGTAGDAEEVKQLFRALGKLR